MPLSPRFAKLLLVSVLCLGACRYSFDNPAEELIPGQIRGKTVQQKEGASSEFEAIPQVSLRLRGAPFQLKSRQSGYFALLDLPAGDYQLLFEHQVPGSDESKRRMVQRQVSLGMGGDAQIEGVNMGDVPVVYTASLSGQVVDEAGAPLPFAVVSDEVSLLSVRADENGHFTFPSLAIGEHSLRVAGKLKLDDEREVQAVGGSYPVKLEKKDERRKVQLSTALKAQKASGEGRLRLNLGLMSPAPALFGLEEVVVLATPCEGGEPRTLAAPSSTGSFDDTLPEGCWNMQMLPPPGEDSAEFDLPTQVSDLVILDDEDFDLGTLLLVSSQSVTRSNNACESDGDCEKGGSCQEKMCAYPPSAPPQDEDPCAKDNGGCHPKASCEQDPRDEDAVVCTCLEGYEGDGLSCLIKDPGGGGSVCEPSPCDENAECEEQEGEAACSCRPGFAGDGFECSKIAFCSDSDPNTGAPLHDCSPFGMCSESEESFECSCPAGMLGDGQTCHSPEAKIALGSLHTCLIQGSRLECWGGNHQGQLGLNDLDARYHPSPVPGEWQKVVAHGTATCGIDLEGKLYCWGAQEPLVNSQAPLQVSEGELFFDVALSADMLCAITQDRRALCWDDGTSSLNDPAPRVHPFHDWSSLHLGSEGMLFCGARKLAGESEHSIWCWSELSSPILAIESFGSEPERIDYLGTFPAPPQLGFTLNDLCFIGGADKGLYCQGAGSPELNLLVEGEWEQLVGNGDASFCASNSDGDLKCWGRNFSGVLGMGSEDEEQEFSLPQLTGSSFHFSALALGPEHGCAISSDGHDLYCWGSNEAGKLMLDHWPRTSDPTPVGVLAVWEEVVSGQGFSCGLREEGELWCWGDNVDGRLPSPLPRLNSPRALEQLSGSWTHVSVQHHAGCAIDPARQLWCWGLRGQLDGKQDSEIVAPSPIGYPSGSQGWKDVSIGSYACALSDASQIACAGSAHGLSGPPLSLSGENTSWDWTLLTTDRGYAKLANGTGHLCAISNAGELFCAGLNDQGQVGQGGDFVSTLQQVFLDEDNQPTWEQVSAGQGFSCAIDASTRLWCWGDNRQGQLGRSPNEVESSAIPLLVEAGNAGGDSWKELRAADEHICAIQHDGSGWCWGNNDEGQLGVINTAPKGSPQRLNVTGFWKSLAPGGVHQSRASQLYDHSLGHSSHTCGVLLDEASSASGKLLCWGSTRDGQSGLPATVSFNLQLTRTQSAEE